MKKTHIKTVSFRSSSTSSKEVGISEVITRMGASLVDWRNSSKSARAGHLADFVVAAREGYRRTAISKLPVGERSRDQAEDMAQERARRLIVRETNAQVPFVAAVIDDLLAEAARDGKPPTGNGSPINGYLGQMLTNGIRDEIDKQWRRPASSLDQMLDAFDPSQTAEPVPAALIGQNIEKKLAVRSEIGEAVRIHDEYLDKAVHKGLPLREALGGWTPMAEWTGHTTLSERSTAVPKRTIQRHMGEIQLRIRAQVRRNGPEDPSM